jgi:hypothetical protein
MKRQPDGTFRGVRQPVKLSEVSIRASWVEAEVMALKEVGVSFEAVAEHITQVGRGLKSPHTPLPDNVVFPADYSISRQAVHKVWVKGISRTPALNADLHRRLNNERTERLWMNLQPAIRKSDGQAVNSAIKLLAHQAKLNGCYGTPRNDGAEKDTKSSITELLAEIGPLDDEEPEKKAG